MFKFTQELKDLKRKNESWQECAARLGRTSLYDKRENPFAKRGNLRAIWVRAREAANEESKEFDRRLTAQLKTELNEAKNKPQSDLISSGEAFGWKD